LAISPDASTQGGKLSQQAFTYFKAGEDQKALECINKAIEIEPAASSYRLRAEIELDMHNFAGALEDAQKAKKAEPTVAENFRMVGRVYVALGKLPDAIKELDTAVKFAPDDHVIRRSRAHLLEQTGQFGKAIVDYTTAIKTIQRQNRASLYEARGKCYMKTKEYQLAVDDFTSALSTTYGRSSLLRYRSQAYKLLGKPELAQKDLQAAVSMDEVFEPPSNLGKDN